MHENGEAMRVSHNSRPQCLEGFQVVQKALIRFAAELEKYILPYVSRGPVSGFIQHADSKLAGSARIMTAELDNMIIYNPKNSSQIFLKDDYSSTDGWTQVGTSVYITK